MEKTQSMLCVSDRGALLVGLNLANSLTTEAIVFISHDHRFNYEHSNRLLSRRRFVLVLLGRAGVGGIKTPLRQFARHVRLEDRFAGRGEYVEIPPAG
jgi:hypothetical protein